MANRQQRRERKDRTHVAVRQYTDEQIENIKAAAIAEALAKRKAFSDEELHQITLDSTMKALELLLAIPVLVMHDKYGFGKVRMDRFLGYINTWVKAVHEDESTMAEIVQLAKETAGYEIV